MGSRRKRFYVVEYPDGWEIRHGFGHEWHRDKLVASRITYRPYAKTMCTALNADNERRKKPKYRFVGSRF